MLIDRRSSVLLALIMGVVSSAHAAAPQTDGPESNATKRIKPTPLRVANQPTAAKAPKRITIENPRALRFYQRSEGAVAGTPPGVEMYRNETDLQEQFFIFTPGSEIMSDDLQLVQGDCDTLAWYEIAVLGLGTSGHPTFNVHTELRTGPACDSKASLIEGTEADFTGLPNDGTTISFLGVPIPLDPAVFVPRNVWLWVSMTAPDAGWVIADQAEFGFTADIFSMESGCSFFFPDNPPRRTIYAGFWAKVNCELSGDPLGACCNGATCSELTEADCGLGGGSWQGAFTSCPCGACCTGDDFAICSQTAQSGCSAQNELFHASTTCDQNPCKPAFRAYVNDFNTGFFEVIPTNATWADDLSFAPCDEFLAFSTDVAGSDAPTVECPTPPPTFEVRTELWTNNDVGTPNNPNDDVPLAPIDGTLTLFSNIQADLLRHTLWAGPFPKTPLNEKVWLVLSTNSCRAGPVFSGMPDPGSSLDAFAVLDDPLVPESFGTWFPGINFGGFNPDPVACPGGQGCVPAGSFRVTAWCQGERPKGTCCNDAAGTFVNNVQEAFCDGRWILDPSANADSFSPPCGLGACCTPLGCTNRLSEECFALGDEFNLLVSFTGGQFCGQKPCPRSECLDASVFGDSCFATHLREGCGDAVCCEAVCGNGVDEACCDPLGSGWDGLCVNAATASCTPTLANDHCRNAMPIDGVGRFDFDTTLATTDGAPHEGCLDGGDQDQIIGDSWYQWTSPCNGVITVTTCGLSDVDTKLAVYNDAGSCPPSDAELIACNDDACTTNVVQATVVFIASVGEKKLIRLGMFPTDNPARGAGQFLILCGALPNAACSGVGDCCAANGSVGCDTTACCNAVCAADPFCCTDTWDAACAGTGRIGTGGGAAVLCGACQLGGDLDGSGFISRADWELLINVCHGGPGVVWSNGMCEAADFDSNGRIDMADVNAFMQVFHTPAP